MIVPTGLWAIALLAQAVSAGVVAPAISGTCRTVAPCVSTLHKYTSRTKFCSSWLGITTYTSSGTVTVTVTNPSTTTGTTTVTSTATSTTGTDTATADTVTVPGTTTTITEATATETDTADTITSYAATPTEEAPTSTSTETTTTTTIICGLAKRAVQTKSIPSPLKTFKSSVITSACKCLSLPTPTTKVTTTATVTTAPAVSATATATTASTQNVAATTTTTPTVTQTFTETSTPTTTTTVTPTTTITPPAVTTTPTTTVTETMTSTVRAGQPAVQLANPTPITPVDSNGTATGDLDDETGWKINGIPFDVGLYNVTSRTLIIGINGWVSPGTTDSFTYQNTVLPNVRAGDPSWVPYWSDLYITGGTKQGIFYEISGDPGQRVLAIEYFMSFYHAPTAYTHFLVNLFENEMGRVVFTYFQTTTQHASLNPQYGTIGVQYPGGALFNQYSYDMVPAEGTSIEWRPSTNQWTQVSQGSC